MGWFTRIDRFGDSHLCYSQEREMSCGLASTKMIVFKINKLRPGHSSTTTEKWVETIYKKHDSTANDVGAEGVFFDRMPLVLNELKIGTWKHESPSNNDIPELLVRRLKPDLFGLGPINSLVRGLPIMLKVDWGGMGSHAVVLDTITKIPLNDTFRMAICDPGDGDVHITPMKKGSPILYNGRRVTFSFNAWGSPEHNYTKGVTIQGTICEVVYCETPP